MTREISLRRLVAVSLAGVLAVGCMEDGGATASPTGQGSGTTSAPAPAPTQPPPPAEPIAGDFARVTVTITGTEVDRASSRLGPDFDDLYIYFTNSYFNISSSQINAIEGFVELRNPFGDVVDRLSFSHLQPVAAGASAVNPNLGVSFKRYECDFSSWKEWCQAFNADFSNFTLDTVVERVALADGRVISSR